LYSSPLMLFLRPVVAEDIKKLIVQSLRLTDQVPS
jgi:hypothetical protein